MHFGEQTAKGLGCKWDENYNNYCSFTLAVTHHFLFNYWFCFLVPSSIVIVVPNALTLSRPGGRTNPPPHLLFLRFLLL